jgi:hypothetical protein
MASGSFQLDQARIWGNGTVFDGSTVESRTAPARIHLDGGTELELAPASRVKVFQGRAVLEQGFGRLNSPGGYRLVAQAVQVSSAAGRAVAAVELKVAGAAVVASLTGRVQIRNLHGILVADLESGQAVTVDPNQDGEPGAAKVTGCLTRQNERMQLTDEVSHVTFEVRGPGLDAEVGNRIEVTGASPVSGNEAGAPQVIQALRLSRLAAGACAAGRAKRAPALAGAAARRLPLRTVAIIGGVTVAGAVGAETAVRSTSGSTESQPATSR